MARKKRTKRWIQKLKKGALHQDLGIPEGQKIPEEMIQKAAKGKGKTAVRARNAIKLAKLRPKATAKRKQKKK